MALLSRSRGLPALWLLALCVAAVAGVEEGGTMSRPHKDNVRTKTHHEFSGDEQFQRTVEAAHKARERIYLKQGSPQYRLVKAAEADDVATVRELVAEHGNDHRKFVNDEGDTAYFAAATNGSIKVVQFFLDEVDGYELETRDDHGATALMVAAWHGKKALVQFLHERGADLHARCLHGWSAAMGAVRYRETEMVEFLHSIGADINHTEKEGRWNSLMIAAAHGDYATAKLLHGVDPSGVKHQDPKGRSALDIAIEAGHTRIADLLRNHRDEL
eukprot:m.481562 g.481562  ORF g.481562 m.481562 type:complete len:273 (+) comp22220_c0_seq1:52-870(+)